MTNHLAGIGLRQPHYNRVLAELPPVGWFEVHSENFFHSGGVSIDTLLAVRKHYPISLHGVGLSLGSASGISMDHLKRVKTLMDRCQPFLISEHLSWSHTGKHYMPDLLPIPYTDEALNLFCQNLNQAQDYLGQTLLIENPSSYLEYKTSYLDEADFLVEICQRTGAKILLDVNNVYVSSCNHGWNSLDYISRIPPTLVHEIHLAGHSEKSIGPGEILRIDTHDARICEPVWDLYEHTLQHTGAVHTLIEWDANIPELEVLMNESVIASRYMDKLSQRVAYA